MTAMAHAIEIYAVVHLVVMGLSHCIHPHSWVAFFTLLRKCGQPGVFAHGFLSLFFGAMIVSFHNAWSGAGAALTVAGWLYVAKAAACFLLPELQLASLRRVSGERAWEMRFAGTAYLLLALWLAAGWAGHP
jgi:hypothetical protein